MIGILLLSLPGCRVKYGNLRLQNHYDSAIQIPFEITNGNNIKFQTVLNGTDTLDLFFDTGATDLVLKRSAIENRTNLPQKRHSNAIDLQPVKGQQQLSIGGLTWENVTIFPVSIGPDETDGHFGWNLFKNKIVGLDYDQKIMTIYSEDISNLALEEYEKLKLSFVETLFCIEAETKVKGQNFKNRFLFDTGFQREVIFDKDIRAKDQFPTDLPVLKESRLKNSLGQEFINQVVKVEEICMGKLCANEVPVQLLSTPNPARFETHIFGNEFLKRFNTIFDFKNGYVYLKPNSLLPLAYVDT